MKRDILSKLRIKNEICNNALQVVNTSSGYEEKKTFFWSDLMTEAITIINGKKLNLKIKDSDYVNYLRLNKGVRIVKSSTKKNSNGIMEYGINPEYYFVLNLFKENSCFPVEGYFEKQIERKQYEELSSGERIVCNQSDLIKQNVILLNLLNEIINYLEQCNSSNSKELSAMQCEAIKVRVTDFLELVSPLDNNSNFELYQTLFWQKEAISQRISDLLNEIAKKDSVKAI